MKGGYDDLLKVRGGGFIKKDSSRLMSIFSRVDRSIKVFQDLGS